MLFFLQIVTERIRQELSNHITWGAEIKSSPARSLGTVVIAQCTETGSLFLQPPQTAPLSETQIFYVCNKFSLFVYFRIA